MREKINLFGIWMAQVGAEVFFWTEKGSSSTLQELS